jgi:polar amino acid transport system substrate-binding protein
MLAVALAAASVSALADDLRFVHDQSVGMPITRISLHGSDAQVIGGLLAELELALARELGYHAVLIATPRKRVEQWLLKGRGDVLCYYDPLWLEHSSEYEWSDPIIANSNLLVFHHGAELPTQLSDLRAGHIGTVNGYVYPELQVLAKRSDVQREDAPDEEANFRKFLAGRTDYLLTHQLYLDYMLHEEPQMADQLGGRLVLRSFETRCAISKTAPITEVQFNAALAALKKRGEYDAILASYR